MFCFNLQFFGGRGGSSGVGGKAATGGRSGTVKIEGNDGSERTVKVTSFSGNDGMVEEIAFGTTTGFAPKQSKLDVTKYDFVISTDPTWGGRELNYNGIPHARLAIGVKMATPQGVSEKQQNYAKSVLKQHLEPTIKRGFQGAFGGKITVENAIQQVKKMPKLSAREILDKWR